MNNLSFRVRLLDIYGRSHNTKYAAKARMVFAQFGDAIIRADNDEHVFERMALENFKEILNKQVDHGT